MTRPTHPRLWTEAEIETLRAGWAAGLSCAKISETLPGRSRCSVAAMADRLTLPIRAAGAHAYRPSAPSRPIGRLSDRDYTPARITLAGPAWSHPSNARAA